MSNDITGQLLLSYIGLHQALCVRTAHGKHQHAVAKWLAAEAKAAEAGGRASLRSGDAGRERGEASPASSVQSSGLG